jgi:hypothetical protein
MSERYQVVFEEHGLSTHQNARWGVAGSSPAAAASWDLNVHDIRWITAWRFSAVVA